MIWGVHGFSHIYILCRIFYDPLPKEIPKGHVATSAPWSGPLLQKRSCWSVQIHFLSSADKAKKLEINEWGVNDVSNHPFCFTRCVPVGDIWDPLLPCVLLFDDKTKKTPLDVSFVIRPWVYSNGCHPFKKETFRTWGCGTQLITTISLTFMTPAIGHGQLTQPP